MVPRILKIVIFSFSKILLKGMRKIGERERRVAEIPVGAYFIEICENQTPKKGPIMEPEIRKI